MRITNVTNTQPSTSDDVNWQVGNGNTRAATPTKSSRGHANINDTIRYWLSNPTKTSNYYHVLQNILVPTKNFEIINKPLLIFVYKVDDIKQLIQLLKKLTPKLYTKKIIN